MRNRSILETLRQQRRLDEASVVTVDVDYLCADKAKCDKLDKKFSVDVRKTKHGALVTGSKNNVDGWLNANGYDKDQKDMAMSDPMPNGVMADIDYLCDDKAACAKLNKRFKVTLVTKKHGVFVIAPDVKTLESWLKANEYDEEAIVIALKDTFKV